MKDRLKFSLFGSFQASLDGQDLRLRQNGAKKLLAVLAYQKGQDLRRSTLSALFWEDVAEGQARQNLRQLLYQMRGHLGEWQGLRVERETLRIERKSVITDLDVILTTLESGAVPDILISAIRPEDQVFGWFGKTGQLMASWIELAKRIVCFLVQRCYQE